MHDEPGHEVAAKDVAFERPGPGLLRPVRKFPYKRLPRFTRAACCFVHAGGVQNASLWESALVGYGLALGAVAPAAILSLFWERVCGIRPRGFPAGANGAHALEGVAS